MPLKIRLLLLFILSLIASPAFADMGIPMIALVYPPMLLTLIPVILIEGYILFRILSISKKHAFKCAAISNLVSTILGVPVMYILMVILEYAILIPMSAKGYYMDDLYNSWWGQGLIVTLFSPVLVSGWPKMIYAAALFLMLVFFFVSWYVEYWVTVRILTDPLNISKNKINRAVFYGNVFSYLFLIAVFTIMFLNQVSDIALLVTN